MASVAARRRLTRRLIQTEQPASQRELVEMLAAEGHAVTQATVSRDLEAIGAAKASEGHYVIPTEAPGSVGDLLERFVTDIAAAGNLVLLRTPPGAAHMVAGALDRARLNGILGTVAGDDTILAVANDAGEAAELARRLEGMAK